MKIQKKRRYINKQLWLHTTLGVLCGVIVLVFVVVLIAKTGRTETTLVSSVATTTFDTANTEVPTETTTEPVAVMAPEEAAELTELTAANISSEHAILLDVQDNTILAQRDPDAKIYPASMTKVMTLLVAAEQIENMDDTFTMTYDILAPLIEADASRAGFEENETVTITDLLYGIALPSGADATTAIAIYLSGSEEEFVKLMNEKAAELGLENTNFMNASGLHDLNHYSTVKDIALLMKYAMENSTCREILSTYQYTTSATEQHPEGIPLESTMFSRMYGNEVTGIEIEAGKTGYTDEAGHCLVSYATDDAGKSYVTVVAKGPTYWRSIFDSFAIYGIIHDGYPLPTDLQNAATDENGDLIETNETSTETTAVY